jgi:hypothetical protein
MGIFKTIVEGSKLRYEKKKNDIEERIRRPEAYRRRKEEKEINEHKRQKPYNDMLLEKKKHEVQMSELNARKARAINKMHPPAPSNPGRASYRQAPNNNPPTYGGGYQGYNPIRIDTNEFMGMPGPVNPAPSNKKKRQKERRGGDPFDFFGGFP